MKPKQIVIDKDAFVGINLNNLCNFAQSHFLILPEVLWYECLTTEKSQKQLLDRFRSVILAEGYFCSRGYAIIQKEADSLSPCDFLVDLEATPLIRQTFQKTSKPYNSKHVKEAHKNQENMAQMIIDLVNGLSKNTASEEPEFIAAMRRFDTSKAESPERFKRWAESVDSLDIHKSAKRLLPGITNSFEKYCLSDEWISWHFVRLLYILVQELWLSKETGDPIKKNRVEHDLQDIEYVLLLSRTNGLLTRDKKLVRPLAKAAFPEKDVFSDLDEVPDEYICHWK